MKWYRLAAEQGNAYAQNNLGVMFQQGQGITQNDKTALKWYRRSAKQGLAISQTHFEKLRKNIAQLEKRKKSLFKPAKQVAAKFGKCVKKNNKGC